MVGPFDHSDGHLDLEMRPDCSVTVPDLSRPMEASRQALFILNSSIMFETCLPEYAIHVKFILLILCEADETF